MKLRQSLLPITKLSLTQIRASTNAQSNIDQEVGEGGDQEGQGDKDNESQKEDEGNEEDTVKYIVVDY